MRKRIKNMKLEVLMSIMNIKNEEQLKNKINQNNITTDVLVINQVENNEDIFEFENIRCFSMNEKGASKSRNNLMRLAKGDICIFADDDMIYDKNYVSVKYRRLEKSVSPGGKNFLAMQIWRFKKFFLNDYFKNIREQLW